MGTLASGFCPNTYQEMATGFAAKMSVTFPDTFSGVEISPTAPADTTKAWMKIDGLGRPYRIYIFAQGAWIALHPQVPGSIMIWIDALPDFDTFDGGDNNAIISAMSGAMWREVTELRGRFPIGVGTPPGGSAIAVGGTGGAIESEVTLTEANLPEHTHECSGSEGGASGTGFNFFDGDQSSSDPPPDPLDLETEAAGEGEPFTVPTLPPYSGVYFLQRTDRLFYVG